MSPVAEHKSAVHVHDRQFDFFRVLDSRSWSGWTSLANPQRLRVAVTTAAFGSMAVLYHLPYGQSKSLVSSSRRPISTPSISSTVQHLVASLSLSARPVVPLDPTTESSMDSDHDLEGAFRDSTSQHKGGKNRVHAAADRHTYAPVDFVTPADDSGGGPAPAYAPSDDHNDATDPRALQERGTHDVSEPQSRFSQVAETQLGRLGDGARQVDTGESVLSAQLPEA